MERPGAHPQERGLIIDCRAGSRGLLNKEQRQTFRTAVVDWPPIARMNAEFDQYVGGMLRVPGPGETLTTACLKAGLGAYHDSLTQPDRNRLIAFLRAFLLIATGWLAGVQIQGSNGDAWSVGHDMSLHRWAGSRSGLRVVDAGEPYSGVCHTLFRVITPPRLAGCLDDGSAIFCQSEG